MKKGKSITLLAICSIIIAVLAVFTFISFPVGIKQYNSVLGAIEKDYDIEGGYSYTYTLAKDNIEEVEDVNDVLRTIAKRIEILGYSSYSIKAIKTANKSVTDYDIRLELDASVNKYGEKDAASVDSDVDIAMAYGELKFYGGTSENPETEIFTKVDNPVKSVKYVGYNTDYQTYDVTITFSDDAWEELSEAMGDSQYFLKITLGDETLSPFTGEQGFYSTYFEDKAITTNSSSEDSANQQVLRISSGGMESKYELVNNISGLDISSNLGSGTLDFGQIAIIAVIVIAVVACIGLAISNKFYGVVSLLSLVAFVVLDLAMLLAVPNIVLSLGSVLGIILATVLTIDGLVIIIKRVNEEYASGKMLKPAIKTGFKRALMPIVTETIIAIVVSLLLFAFTSGAYKGFGITLAIGVVISIISTLLIARLFTNLILGVCDNKASSFNLKRDNDTKEAL